MNSLRHGNYLLEKQLAAQLGALLGSVPWLKDVQITLNPPLFEQAFDICARVKLPNRKGVELLVVCQDQPRPSRFPCFPTLGDGNSAKMPRAWGAVLAAPFISERIAELCEQQQWSWFDLAGNCRLNVPDGLFIERRGNAPVHRLARPAANLSTPESARILRALLAPANAGRRWTQRDLQRHCQPGVSIGLVNKVALFLREQAYVTDRDDGGFHLLDPLGLLKVWRAAYRFDRHIRRGYFSLQPERQLRHSLATLESITGGHAAYAAFSAADLQAPHVRQPKTWLFLGAEWEDEFAAAAEARLVDSGENLVVLLPEDNGVFYLQEAEGHRLPCTNPVQTYLDLTQSGGRGEEAAQALLEQSLEPAWRLVNIER